MTTENKLPKALLEAQMEMGKAIKDASNPFFKSKYADLNAIREACMPSLNKHGIVVLQPTIVQDGKNYVKTLLLHESGESMECLTEIIFSKPNDAQAQGSGITYARRYGLQSFVNVGADDDDGNNASTKPADKKTPEKREPSKPELVDGSEAYLKAVDFMEKGGDIQAIKKKYILSSTVEEKLLNS
jgi:Tfp pilus assembly protein PilZ